MSFLEKNIWTVHFLVISIYAILQPVQVGVFKIKTLINCSFLSLKVLVIFLKLFSQNEWQPCQNILKWVKKHRTMGKSRKVLVMFCNVQEKCYWEPPHSELETAHNNRNDVWSRKWHYVSEPRHAMVVKGHS